MFGLKPKTVHHWYKEELSDYRRDIREGKWGVKKIVIVDEDTGEIKKEKPVPIAKPENMGSHMTIDEKQIGKAMYSIMTNAQTGKIALLAQSLKVKELKQAIENYFPDKIEAVKSISCDMSPSYKKLCKEVFVNTQLVIDKFHVIKHLMDALQTVRRQLKTDAISNEQTIPLNEHRFWSGIELLERSRYMLCKMQSEWDEDEQRMMDYLFQNFPVLQTAYQLTQKLRLWYNAKNIGKHINIIEIELYQWCDEVNQSNIPALRAVKRMIEKHHDDIINYFKEGQTNAKAENMNGKIQRFLTNNFGIKDRDFFMYRIAGYFS